MKKLKKAGCIFMSANMLLTTVAAATSMADSINNSDVLAGKNRYETANKIAQRYFKKADTVILVNGDAVADALSVAPLAKKLDAPILLTDTNKMDAQTEKILKDYNPNKIIIIGGQNSVSKNLEAKLKGILAKASIERIDGKNRIDTSMIIANKLGLSTKGAFIVNGFKGLPDAASAGACAAKEGMPLIFVDKNINMYKSMIEKLNLQKLYLIGGTSSISPEFDIKDKTERLAGKNRRDTNLAILEKFYNTGVKEAFIAKDGMNNVSQLIDSVTIGGIAGKFNMPIILGSVTGGLTQGQLDYIKSKNFEKFIGVGFGNYEAGAQLKGLGKGYSLEGLVKETPNKDKDTNTTPINTSNSKKKSKDKKKDEKTPKQVAEEKVDAAEKAKEAVEKAIADAGNIVNPTEKSKIDELIKDYNNKKQDAKKAVEALTPKDAELEKREKALTEVKAPEVNDKNSNGIKDDLEEAVTNAEKEIKALQFESDAEKQKAVEAIKKANTAEDINKITEDIKTVNNVNEKLKDLVEKVNGNITELGSIEYNPKTYEAVVTMELKGAEKGKDIIEFGKEANNTGFIVGLQGIKDIKSYIIEGIDKEKIKIQDSTQEDLKSTIIKDLANALSKFGDENKNPDNGSYEDDPGYAFAIGKEMIVPIKAFIGKDASIERTYTFKIKASENLKKILMKDLEKANENSVEADSVVGDENSTNTAETVNAEALSTFNSNRALRSRRVARSVVNNELREDVSTVNTNNETDYNDVVNNAKKKQDEYIKNTLKLLYSQTLVNSNRDEKKIFLSMLEDEDIINFAINPNKNDKKADPKDLSGTGLKTVLERLMNIEYMDSISFNNEKPRKKTVYKGTIFYSTAAKVAKKVIHPMPNNYKDLVGREVPFEIFCKVGDKEFSRKFVLKFTNDYNNILKIYEEKNK